MNEEKEFAFCVEIEDGKQVFVLRNMERVNNNVSETTYPIHKAETIETGIELTKAYMLENKITGVVFDHEYCGRAEFEEGILQSVNTQDDEDEYMYKYWLCKPYKREMYVYYYKPKDRDFTLQDMNIFNNEEEFHEYIKKNNIELVDEWFTDNPSNFDVDCTSCGDGGCIHCEPHRFI